MSEYVKLGDMVRFGVTIHSPSGIGALINADETPRFYAYINNSDTVVLQGNFVARANLIGTYLGSGIFSAGNGFSTNDYVEVHASGKVNGIQGRKIVRTFVIDDLYNVNVVAVSSIPVTVADDIFYFGMKFVKDSTVPRDEYVIQWFKNSVPLESGQVTNPALSVYKTSDGTSLFQNAVLNYFSPLHGGLRYNDATNLAVSGEPYLAVASGTIDSSTRVWKNPFGLDYL